MGSWPTSVVMPTFAGDLDNVTIVQECANMCGQRNSVVMGIDSGVVCWCADRLPAVRGERDSFCRPCADDETKTCGDVNYGFVSVYEVIKTLG
jgi:hypothetical protein